VSLQRHTRAILRPVRDTSSIHSRGLEAVAKVKRAHVTDRAKMTGLKPDIDLINTLGCSVKPLTCLRVECAHGRGSMLETELINEFVTCFRKVAIIERKWAGCLKSCAPQALWVALTASIPILSDTTEEVIKSMDRVLLMVTKVFICHLRETWYGVENSELDRLYSSVSHALRNLGTSASVKKSGLV
jgi:hypothetical protein